MYNYLQVIVYPLVFFCINLGQSVLINEVMSSNTITIADEDGEYPDWIELYNTGATSINLGEMGLSDDPDDLFKWTFPQMQLESDSHLLIFASGKDRTVHWETIITLGDDWRYAVGSSAPPDDWREINFEDESWSLGPSGFGYGDGDDATLLPHVISAFVRISFEIESLAVVEQAILHVDYDDAFVAYLNGVEIARANIGIPGIIPDFDQGADSGSEAQIYAGGLPEAFPVNLDETALLEDFNVLAIEVHNFASTSSDMSLIPFFTLGMSQPPTDPLGPYFLLDLGTSLLHTNFRINSDGENLILSDPDGQQLDSLFTGMIPLDTSLGRSPDGGETWGFFSNPTPGLENDEISYDGILSTPVFSLEAGFYADSVAVTITSEHPSGDIRFTTDGSKPTEDSPVYMGPVAVNETIVLKARVFEPEYLPSETVTSTYFINDSSELTVISLSTDPDNFWDYDYGIYVMGPNASPDIPHYGANFWQDWERPIHIELFETNQTLGFSSNAGVKIFGNWSRRFPQKSLSLFARGEYGSNAFNYAFFENRFIDSYQALVLRNSGSDWPSTMMRDGMMASLVDNEGIDLQAYRPAAVYINGDYWGIYNIREKVNEHFIAGNHGVDPDNIDLLYNNANPILGDASHYNALIDYLSNEDITLDENYNYVKTQMDIDNFISYQAAEIYFCNTDWPANNIKFWRPRTDDGRWRWIMFDTDVGFGRYDQEAYTNNSLEFALATDGPYWPNPPWSTFMLRRLVENEDFRTQFINRFCDLFNTTLKTESVLAHIDSIKSVIEPEIPAHIDRWEYGPLNWWNLRVDVIENFGQHRYTYMIEDLQEQFNLEDLGLLTVDISAVNTGHVQVNSVIPDDYPWSGDYFQDLEIHLKALPAQGFQFTEWSTNYGSDADIIINQTPVLSITAHFEPIPDYSEDIIINEINYNSADDFDAGDWIEFYNPASVPINISRWQFKDSDDDHIFEFPENTVMDPEGYLVICTDIPAFNELFSEVETVTEEVSFGFSGSGELLRLFNFSGEMVDSLVYSDSAPWPPEADGDGATLELIDFTLDNALPENWQASPEHGSPGFANSSYSEDIIINEINYNSADDFDAGDWIEFYNPASVPINISRWQFKDSDDDHIFEFPENTVMDPEGYLVICTDIPAFNELFSEVETVTEEVSFGFSGSGELLRLFNFSGEMVDSLVYSDSAPWPPEADGDGATLELIDPVFDNALAESWQASINHGTPGAMNSVGATCYHNGDVTLDGMIDILDIVAIVSHILGDSILDELQFCNADVTGDDVLDVLDVVAIVDTILDD